MTHSVPDHHSSSITSSGTNHNNRQTFISCIPGDQGSVLLGRAGARLSPPAWGRKKLLAVKFWIVSAQAPVLGMV